MNRGGQSASFCNLSLTAALPSMQFNFSPVHKFDALVNRTVVTKTHEIVAKQIDVSNKIPTY